MIGRCGEKGGTGNGIRVKEGKWERTRERVEEREEREKRERKREVGEK